MEILGAKALYMKSRRGRVNVYVLGSSRGGNGGL
jgi:hypothetical protein